MITQLAFFEKNQLQPMWPDSTTLEFAVDGLFDRLKLVREVDKKHIQRRAFIDLLLFMKG